MTIFDRNVNNTVFLHALFTSLDILILKKATLSTNTDLEGCTNFLEAIGDFSVFCPGLVAVNKGFKR